MKFLENNKKLIFWLFFSGLIVYLNALGNQLFWDDHDGIVNNAFIKDWKYFRNYFSENLIAGSGLQSNYWRPTLLIIYSLGFKIWGLWPAGFHLVNILIHILAGLLLFKIFLLLTKKSWLAFFPALFFIIHPLQTEAVTYVSGLADPLSAVFIFGGLLFHIKNRSQKKYWPIYLFFILGLMTKEKTLIIFPSLFALLEIAFFLENNRGNNLDWKNWLVFLKNSIQKYWPILAIGSFYILLRATSLNFQNTFNLYDQPNLYADSLFIRIWTFLEIFPAYLGLIFWPFNLHMERSVPIATTLFAGPVFLGLLFLGFFLWRFFYWAKKNSWLFFSLGWFLVTILASSGIPAVSAGIMYEHYLYLPLAGFFLWIFLELDKKKYFFENKPIFQKIGWLILIFLFFFFSILTFKRNLVWKNPIIFYENVLQYNQQSLRIWNNLGMAYAEANQQEKAILAYQKAIELDPEKQSMPPRHNLANIFSSLGRKTEAIDLYKEVLSTDPNFIFSYYQLLKIWLEEKKYQEALTFFQDLRQKSPQNRWEIDDIIKELEKQK